MFRRPWILLSLVLLLAVLPACKKKPFVGSEPLPAIELPEVVNSDCFLYTHLNAKEIRDSDIFKEMQQAFRKAGGVAEWDKIDSEVKENSGVKFTAIDSVTICTVEAWNAGALKQVAIISANEPFDKATLVKDPNPKPDAQGFYKKGTDEYWHFPDEKTAVALHMDLAQGYLDGYAKNRSGWPLNAELTKAAAGHTLFAVVNAQKLPREAFNGPRGKELEPLLGLQTATLAADLKGKTLSVGARAKFPDAAAADKARDSVQQIIKMATSQIDKFMNSEEIASLSALKPAIQEAQRSLTDVKLEIVGSDLTLTGRYTADCDLAALASQIIKQRRDEAVRTSAARNYIQLGMALHNYDQANFQAHQGIPVHGIGPKGAILQNATDKPLLSWRVAMLPYLEQDNLYKQFHLDEPWDSEHNKKLIDKMPKVFAPVAKPSKPGYTHMQMVVGPNAMQPPSLKFGTVIRGLRNTIAVVEAAEPVIWTKPDDVMLPGKEWPKDLKKKFGGQFLGAFTL